MFPYALSPHYEEAMQITIGVIRKTSAKLSHYTSLVLTYPVENEMPLKHHAIKRWGCNYINKTTKA